MTKIIWDAVGSRTYETGVDRGVLYTQNSSGQYVNGVAWNGLTAVSESPSGAEANAQYADNIKYLNLFSAEDFGATIEAFTYPDEFAQFDGVAEPKTGVYVGQQARKTFGFSYRTKIGNDLDGDDHGYKIHLIYGCTASPSERSYATVNESPEAMTLSWEITTVATEAGANLRPTACVIIDSTKVAPGDLTSFEEILYGTALLTPRMPSVPDVIAMFDAGIVTVVTTLPPTIDTLTNIITIPNVTGVDYFLDGEAVPAGPTDPIEEDAIVTAIAKAGYALSPTSDDDWVLVYTP